LLAAGGPAPPGCYLIMDSAYQGDENCSHSILKGSRSGLFGFRLSHRIALNMLLRQSVAKIPSLAPNDYSISENTLEV
jgi:hypothetical protein